MVFVQCLGDFEVYKKCLKCVFWSELNTDVTTANITYLSYSKWTGTIIEQLKSILCFLILVPLNQSEGFRYGACN